MVQPSEKGVEDEDGDFVQGGRRGSPGRFHAEGVPRSALVPKNHNIHRNRPSGRGQEDVPILLSPVFLMNHPQRPENRWGNYQSPQKILVDFGGSTVGGS